MWEAACILIYKLQNKLQYKTLHMFQSNEIFNKSQILLALLALQLSCLFHIRLVSSKYWANGASAIATVQY